MMLLSTLLAIACAARSLASSITWSDCKLNTSLPVSCGTLQVPLDYTDERSNKTITYHLVKLRAAKQPSKGSVLLNPGGPGIAGRNVILEAGDAISLMVGEDYDLIGFDPRGTGETIPFSCFSTTIERSLLQLLTPAQLTASNTAPGTIWGTRSMQAETCYQNARDTGELIGTAFVARDMMQIVDALGEDGMLRFYGFSYGTILGATVAAMFPNRIDKLVLDGVVNVDEYYSGGGFQEVIDSDSVYEGFFSGCIQSPELCVLAQRGVSAQNLSQSIAQLLDEVKYHPIVLGPTAPTDLVDYRTLKGSIFAALYAPAVWPSLALLFDAVLERNLTNYVAALTTVNGVLGSALGSAAASFPQKQGTEALQGIRCSDSALRASNLSELQPLLREYEAASYIIGDQEPASITIPCAVWKMSAKERYTGGFSDVQTKSPVLFVGNTHDPLTPLVSAKNVSAGFPNSSVLTVNAYGHTSTAQPSLCAAKVIRAYFVDGTLPDPGTICQASVPLFRSPSASLSSVLQPLNHTRRSDEEEDLRLLLASDRVHRSVASRARRQ